MFSSGVSGGGCGGAGGNCSGGTAGWGIAGVGMAGIGCVSLLSLSGRAKSTYFGEGRDVDKGWCFGTYQD